MANPYFKSLVNYLIGMGSYESAPMRMKRNSGIPLAILLLFVSASGFAQENCFNAIDDDADGLVDLNDSECRCNLGSTLSIIPNPSFEEHTGCPTSFSELFYASPWVQATEATTDYFNTCGYVLPALAGTPLLNFPQGDGVVGALFMESWNEYVGTTLPTPLLANTHYQLTFNIAATRVFSDGTIASGGDVSVYEPVNVTLYGSADSGVLPLPTVFSPDQYNASWQELGHATYSPLGAWGEITLTFTPTIDIHSIMLGAPPVLPVSFLNVNQGLPYFLYDNLLLNKASEFGVNIRQTGFYCENNLVLTANLTSSNNAVPVYQWYKNGIAIIGATQSTFAVGSQPSDLADYSVSVSYGTACFASNTAINASLPSPEALVVQATCFINSGTISIVTPAAQYSFDNGLTWQSNPVKSGLPIGDYFIKIKSASGCISSAAGIRIVEPSLLDASAATATQPQACGESGTITVNSTIAAQYSFDDGISWVTNAVADNLQPGQYIVRIKDAAGCMSGPQYVNIYDFYLPTPDFTSQDLQCGTLGSINILTPADWYSFDDGLTWTNNPVASNLAAGSYSVKIKNDPDCESSTLYIYLYPFYLDLPEYETVMPSCGGPGSITITTPADAYSFDGGISWSANNTLSGLSSGFYPIMIRNAQGCISSEWYDVYLWQQNFAMPPYSVNHPFCLETTGSIEIEPLTGFEYSFDGGFTYGISNSSGPLDPGGYSLIVRDTTGCVSDMSFAYINSAIGIPSAPTGETQQFFCVHNNPTVAFLTASGENIKWYAPGNPVALSSNEPLVSGMYFASQTTALGCESPDLLSVQVSIVNYPIPVLNYGSAVCDEQNDGQESVNLLDYRANLIANPENYTFSFYTSFSGADTALSTDRISNQNSFIVSQNIVVYARIVAANGCWEVAELELNPVFVPVNSIDSEHILCEFSHVTLQSGSGFDGYLWSTGETTSAITVREPGNYSVTIFENHGQIVCSSTKNLTVQLSNPATITRIDTSDWTDEQNAIRILVEGLGDYEYSLDGENYQSSNEFTGLLSGEYQVYVRDRNECGEVDQTVFLLMYPKYFTPNNDGKNDSWNIKFSRTEPEMSILLFDRQGKFIKQLSPMGSGWDGTYNGIPLPSTDYWFTVKRSNGKEHKGHFTLKR